MTVPHAEPQTVLSRPRVASDTGELSPGMLFQTPPPAPMIEPIAITNSPAPVCKGTGSVLIKGLEQLSPGALASGVQSADELVRSSGESTHEATKADSNTPAPVPQPRLIVVRGERLSVEYPIIEGKNYIGRSADKPVDIDLEGQESIDRVWTSRQHAVLTLERGTLMIEDLNSLNGTYVNRNRVHAGSKYIVRNGDIVQVGTVQMKVNL